MRINWYLLSSGKLRKQPAPQGWPTDGPGQLGESWFDIEDAGPEELRQFLAPLNIHPLMLARCLDLAVVPGVISYGPAILLEYPAAPDREAEGPAYLTFVMQSPVLVTIRHGLMPGLNDLIQSLVAEGAPSLSHLVQILYLILDDLTDLSVQTETEVRDQILRMAKILNEDPGAVRAGDLTKLRWQVDQLVSLVENQLYCIAGLNSSDNEALREPHRKAYIQDLASEVEIAQRGIYRLETRVNDLHTYYQMASSDRVEKRLRVLTIVSAITLPLGLIAGLLGMNVGGLPGAKHPYGFLIVIVLMVALAVVELWYFKRKGWFD
jgi:Mg2+ and Co2+ transporter CorA